jgi:hypothetical protein
MVVPEFQGRGVALAATAQAIDRAKQDGRHRFMHAFPNVENATPTRFDACWAGCRPRMRSADPCDPPGDRDPS